MALKVYVSGMSGNKEVKKRQQRVLMILDSKNVKYDLVDITEPGKEAEKDMMQTKSTSNGATVSDPNPRHPLPPQIFNDDEYCGDYDAFDLANEIDTLEQFLKLAPADTTSVSTAQIELKKETTDAPITQPAEDNKENEENLENGDVESKDETATNENGEKKDDGDESEKPPADENAEETNGEKNKEDSAESVEENKTSENGEAKEADDKTDESAEKTDGGISEEEKPKSEEPKPADDEKESENDESDKKENSDNRS